MPYSASSKPSAGAGGNGLVGHATAEASESATVRLLRLADQMLCGTKMVDGNRLAAFTKRLTQVGSGEGLGLQTELLSPLLLGACSLLVILIHIARGNNQGNQSMNGSINVAGGTGGGEWGGHRLPVAGQPAHPAPQQAAQHAGV